jgi:hypothetical protein
MDMRLAAEPWEETLSASIMATRLIATVCSLNMASSSSAGRLARSSAEKSPSARFSRAVDSLSASTPAGELPWYAALLDGGTWTKLESPPCKREAYCFTA